MAPPRIDRKGARIGHQTCLGYSGMMQGKDRLWLWLCDCGNVFKRRYQDAIREGVKTCGQCHLSHEAMSESARTRTKRQGYAVRSRCKNCGRSMTAFQVRRQYDYCSTICSDQSRRMVHVDFCIDDPIRTPGGRPAVVRKIHNDGRVDIRYTDDLRDPGCTLMAAMLVKRSFKRPSAAIPRPSALERGWLPGQKW